MRRRLPWTIVPIVALLAAGCAAIRDRLIARLAVERFEKVHDAIPDDGSLHVVLCGTAGTPADPERANACTAVLAGGRFVLVDAGPGSWNTVSRARLPAPRLDAIVITHFHSDHIGGLGDAIEGSWIAGRRTPLPVYGPPGIEEVVAGFERAWAANDRYRIALHGPDRLPPAGAGVEARAVPVRDGAARVFSDGGLEVTAFRVDHHPAEPAYGYRFDYAGRSVVVSGDTRPSRNLVRYARGADVLVHEAAAAHLVRPAERALRASPFERWGAMAADVLASHTTPEEAARVADDAGVRLLVLTHVIPPVSGSIAKRMFLETIDRERREHVAIGEDGMHLEMPPGGSAIIVGRL